MNFTQIKETCLYSHDLARAEDFYKNILGLPRISAVEGRHVFFRAGTSVLLIFNPDVTHQEGDLPPHWAEGKAHIAFECLPAEYELYKQGLTAEGITITHEQVWPKGHKSFYFNDPDGHVLEIVQQGMWD